MTIWRMRFPCWVPKATDTHSEYVLIIAFPLQQTRRNVTVCVHCLYSLIFISVEEGTYIKRFQHFG
jgi:hypothetical protein